jgi:hypothetical protein
MVVGCSARKPIASTYTSFRLESWNHDSVLLTPAIPEGHAGNAAITVTLNMSWTRPPVGMNCSVERGPFRLEQVKNHPDSIQITLPAPEKWLGDVEGQVDPNGSDAVQALYVILADLDQLQPEGCFEETSA